MTDSVGDKGLLHLASEQGSNENALIDPGIDPLLFASP